MNEDTKQYQIVMVFPPVLNPEQLSQAIEKVKQIITDQQGSFSSIEIPSAQLKRLSYPINKHQEAFYLTLGFSLPPQAIELLNQQLNLENDLIRHIITTQDQIKIRPKQKQTIDYSEMIEKVEPIKENLSKVKPAKKTVKLNKVELDNLDKKLEEILNK